MKILDIRKKSIIIDNVKECEYMKLPETLTVPMEEQETLISWSRNDAKIKIYTSDNTMLTKLRKLLNNAPENYILVHVENDQDGNPYSVTFEANANCVSLRQGKEKNFSEEFRQELSERMKAMRKKG